MGFAVRSTQPTVSLGGRLRTRFRGGRLLREDDGRPAARFGLLRELEPLQAETAAALHDFRGSCQTGAPRALGGLIPAIPCIRRHDASATGTNTKAAGRRSALAATSPNSREYSGASVRNQENDGLRERFARHLLYRRHTSRHCSGNSARIHTWERLAGKIVPCAATLRMS